MIHLRYTLQSDEQCKTPGEVLRYYRQFKNISTRELAERVGVVPATIVLYENDRHPIDYKVATTCAEVLGIEPERLYDEYAAFINYPCSELLRKIRTDLSMSQAQMAEQIGISQSSYSGWERGARKPRKNEYKKIKAVFPQYLFESVKQASASGENTAHSA